MKKYDLLIIGGGMVGLSLALAVRKLTSLTVAIADTSPVTPLTDTPELRVSAINAASNMLFNHLDVWQHIDTKRSQPYQNMHVWDKAGYGKLCFDHLSANQPQLGHIIENKVIRHALWQQAQQDAGISFYTDEAINNIGIGESEVFASFSSQMPITAKLVVGADGANSWLRQQLKMAMTFRDYDHHAIVATIATSHGHENTAWQVFLPTGPLALLPLAHTKKMPDGSEQQLVSIVWSTTPDEAKRLLALPKEEFNQALASAADGKLGVLSLESERVSYPLTMRLAQNFIQDRALLIGDAAHTIHPLAGQGVNLGLKDAAALADTLQQSAIENGGDISELKALKAFERWRKNDASEMVVMMEAIKQIFTPQQTPTQVLRGLGMELLNNMPLLKKPMIKQALGFQRHMPSLMTQEKSL